MATGDLEGNLDRLRVQLRTIGYPHPIDMNGVREGNTASILPLLHYALLGYSRHVARYLSENGYALFAKSDLRFVEYTLKYLREEFAYRCPLTVAQIFARGFAERKILLVYDVIQVCKRKHSELVKQARQAQQARKTVRRDAGMCSMAKNADDANIDTSHVNEALSLALEKVLHGHMQAYSGIVTEPQATKLRDLDLENQVEEAGVMEERRKEKPSSQAKIKIESSEEDGPLRRIETFSTAKAETQKHQNVDNVSDVDPSLSLCYDKLRTQIVDVAEKLEELIYNLKEDVERITSGMQLKLSSLERQSQYLQQALPFKSLIETKGIANHSCGHPYISSSHGFSRTNILHNDEDKLAQGT